MKRREFIRGAAGLLVPAMGWAQSIPPAKLGLGFSGAGSPSHSMNWNPGYYGLTATQLQGNTANTFAGTWQPEIDLCVGKTNVVGFSLFVTWGWLEYQTLGNWQFGGSFIFDQIYNYCAANNLKLIIQINPNQFNNGTPNAPSTSSNNPYIPGYLTQDSTTYGAGLYGSSGVTPTGASGFWVQQTGGFGANLSNANVLSRWQAMLTALAAKYDGLLEAVICIAVDNYTPYSGAISGTAYKSAVTAMYQAAKSAFTKTNVAIQMGWGGGMSGWTPTDVQNWAQTLVQAGVLVSSSDSVGDSAWGAGYAPNSLSDGVNAWLGNQASWNGSTWTPPTPALGTYSHSMMQVQGGDTMGQGQPYSALYTPADVITAMNGRYNCSHPQFSIWQSTAQQTAAGFTAVPGALWSNVLTAMAAQGVTNTSYPSVYP